MDALSELQADLTILIDEIAQTCQRYRYDAVPTILLRHTDGTSKSILVSNDNLGQVVLTIAELGEIGNESSMSPHEAVLKLFAAGAD